MEEKNKRKQIAKISVFITSIFVIFLSVTYAFINTTLTGTRRQVITTGNLELVLDEDENNLQIVDAMPMYDEVGMLQEAFTFRLINKTSVNTDYILKLEDITVGSPLSKEDVKYGLTKDDEVTIDFVSTITDEVIDQGTISGNTTIEYSLRLWIKDSVTEVGTIQNKNLRYKMNIEATMNPVVEEVSVPVNEKAFAAENLGASCKTYDDGVDTFLVGQCQNNYVWYSGKLWRVVLKNNSTGAVKMVTDNAMTTISNNTQNGYVYSSEFKNSDLDQWLSQEFLPTLHDYEGYLVTDSVWDASTNNSSTPTRPNNTTTINRTVGLLNGYEYYTTYNKSDGIATSETGYLNSNTMWWTITPCDTKYTQFVNKLGNLYAHSGSGVPMRGGNGVRPVVNLKSTVQIVSGTGIISDPYRLSGDTYEIVNGTTLLNTRYSGEYITFNNELYRIIRAENNLTKIIAVDKPSGFSAIKFNSTSSKGNSFANSDIKTELDTYYQGLDTTTKNMIEPNTTWYLGETDSSNGQDYKYSICASANDNIDTISCDKTTNTAIASIGLLRFGEIFASQITRGTKSDFWLLTRNVSGVSVISSTDSHTAGYLDSKYNIRPSMYLKSTVKIASSNTGDGTYEHPYTIELK